MSSRRFVVGRAADLAEGDKMAVDVNGRSIAIFNVKGRFYGLLNRCPHRGAELCAGRFLPLVTATAPGRYEYDTERSLLACPWHGWEFDVTTGQSYFDPTGTRGRPFAVEVERGALVASEVDSGEVNLRPGPYRAETVAIDVEDDYLVVDLHPRRVERQAQS